jgi:hypothetical protein
MGHFSFAGLAKSGLVQQIHRPLYLMAAPVKLPFTIELYYHLSSIPTKSKKRTISISKSSGCLEVQNAVQIKNRFWTRVEK